MSDPVAKIDSLDLAPNPANTKEQILTINTSTVVDGVTHTSSIKCVSHDYIFHGAIPTADQIKATIVSEANKVAAMKDLVASLQASVGTDLVAEAKGK